MRSPGCARRAVHAHNPGAALTSHGVSFEPLSTVDVPDMNSFVGKQVGRFEESAIHRETAFIVQIRLSHGRTVDLRF